MCFVSRSAISAILFAMLSPISAQPNLPTPGSSWGELRFPGSEQREDEENLILEGAVEQGIDLVRLSKDSVLGVFGKVDYTLDTKKLDWNRKLKLGTGIKLRHYVSSSKVVSVGVKYELDRRFVHDRTMEGVQFFANWFASWSLPIDFADDADSALGIDFPGLTWGEIRYPGSHVIDEEDDFIVEGAIEQGVDWVAVPNWGTFNTYAALDYIADTEELSYNNALTLGVGAKFKRKIGSQWLLQYGIELAHDQRWVTGRSEDAVVLFLNWSGWWDARATRLDFPKP